MRNLHIPESGGDCVQSDGVLKVKEVCSPSCSSASVGLFVPVRLQKRIRPDDYDKDLHQFVALTKLIQFLVFPRDEFLINTKIKVPEAIIYL